MTKKKNRKQNYRTVTVPFSATPTGAPPDIRNWASTEIWTESMLTTLLESKVRGGKWHTLFDKVWKQQNLIQAAYKVIGKRGAAGIDHQQVQQFDEQLMTEINQLQREVKEESYQPLAVKRVEIPKPGSNETRPLGIPAVRDRVVQTALLQVIEPILDHTFHGKSYGFRHGRGCKEALECVEALLNTGHVYVVDVDLKSYFDTIPKDRLLELVQQKISDGAVLRLIEKYLNQSVMTELATWTPETGVPQGAVLSPLLANAYLNPLDHLMAAEGFEMVRYADDFVILCKSQEEATVALEKIRNWVTQAGLTIHPTKTKIVDFRVENFEFLGYSFRDRFRFPRKKSHDKLMDRICELTPRNSGESLRRIVEKLNMVLHGWFQYFRHCFWNTFDQYDGRIRERLRAILNKRNRRNRHRQTRQQRWPNQYFFENKLFSLREAHTRLVDSLDY